MSWFGFSDIAKTAFNEAQKRIDKVLDIQEAEQKAKVNLTTNESSAFTSLSTLINTDSVTAVQLNNTALNDTPKTQVKSPNLKPSRSLNNLSQKKRAKPSKLGVSLTKKSSPREKEADETMILSEGNLTKREEIFDEISLDEPKEERLGDEEIINNNFHEPADITHSSKDNKCDSIKDLHSDYDKGDDKVEVNENTSMLIAHKKMDDFPRIHAPVLTCSAVATHSMSASPATTTTSSEIDILDHESRDESTHSDHSPVMQHIEYEDVAQRHFPFPTSPDHSEESDIIQLNGHCSPPISNEDSDPIAFIDLETLHQSASEELELDVQVKESTEDTSQSTIDDSNHRTQESGDSLQESSTSTLQSSQTTNLTCSIEDDNQDMLTVTIADALKEDSNLELVPNGADLPENTLNLSSNNGDNTAKPVLLNNNIPAEVKDTTYSIITDIKHEVEDIRDSMELDQESLNEIEQQDSHEIDENVPESIVSNEAKGSEGVSELSKDEIIKMMNEKFVVYEQQLMTLSLSNAKLNEDYDNLRSESTNMLDSEKHEYQKEKQNLLNTIDSISQQLQNMELEKSDLSEKLQIARTSLSQRFTNDQVQQLITEKEESIQGLLQEGEALSKKHLQQSNAIKKLRAKALERDETIKDISEKLTKAEDENKTLKQRLSAVEGQSSEDRGTAERITEAYQERELELMEMRNKLEDAEEKRRAAQATLDSAYKDLAEMNKREAAVKSDHESDLQNREDAVRKMMQQEMNKMQQDHDHQRQIMLLQMAELRSTVERTEMICSRREDQLKKEIQDLQQQLQDSELRNHELGENISASTRPLLRQMENLQATHSAQEKTWESLEKSLTSRLNDQQSQLLTAQEKERTAQMALMEAKSRLQRSELQLNDALQAKDEITDEIESLRKNQSEHEQAEARYSKQLEEMRQQHCEVMSKARRDRVNLENQLDMEKVRLEVERKKYQSQVETVQKEKERLLWLSRSESIGSSASVFNTDAESVASSSDTFNHLDVVDRPLSQLGSSVVYDTIRAASGSALLENLQSQLKQRDGEIAQLQGEINTLERTRSSMAEEIVRLTNENEDLEVTAGQVDELRKKLKEVTARHDAVLTMYGEKAEEAEELKLDLQDVKAMYRNQIDSLLRGDSVK